MRSRLVLAATMAHGDDLWLFECVRAVIRKRVCDSSWVVLVVTSAVACCVLSARVGAVSGVPDPRLSRSHGRAQIVLLGGISVV